MRALPVLALMAVPVRASVIIDFFDAPRSGEGLQIPSSKSFDALNDPAVADVLGGDRYMQLEKGGSNAISWDVNKGSTPNIGNLTTNNTSGLGTLTQVYDANKNHSTVQGGYSVNTFGLGQIDLTSGGADNAIAFRLGSNTGGTFTITVFEYGTTLGTGSTITSATHASTATYAISPSTFTKTANLLPQVYLPFTTFTAATGAGSSANLQKIGAVVITLSTAVANADVNIAELETGFYAPEPATFGLIGTALCGMAFLRRRKS